MNASQKDVDKKNLDTFRLKLSIITCTGATSTKAGETDPTKKIGVLAATVGPARDFQKLDSMMYRLRRKYISDENAKDRSSELKGTQLLGNNSFKMLERHGLSKNLCLTRELLEFVPETSIRYIGVTV